MSYVVNKTNGNIVAVIEDGALDTISTSLTLVGKGTSNYGEYIAENSVRMLENFANTTAPAHPIIGQLWYNTTTDKVVAYNGTTWEIPVPQTFYSSVADTIGTGSITVSNNSGIKVGTASTAQLAIESGNAVLKTNTTNAFTINPADGLVTVVADPSGNLGIATKQYVDTLGAIGPNATNKATVSTNSLSVVLVGETMLSADNTGVTLAGVSYVTNTPEVSTNNLQIASTAFVQNNKASPVFTGTPTAPTASTATNTTQLATTAFVQNNKASPVFTGTPTAPTATAGTSTTQISTTAFVMTRSAADKVSTALTGIPTAPTATAGTSTTQISTTQFVGTAISNIDFTPYAPKASPALTGIPTAPTATVGTGTTQIATTSYVMTATERWAGSRKFVSSADPTSGDGTDGDFWFKII